VFDIVLSELISLIGCGGPDYCRLNEWLALLAAFLIWMRIFIHCSRKIHRPIGLCMTMAMLNFNDNDDVDELCANLGVSASACLSPSSAFAH